jgi:membrane protein required for colicin V production
VNYLDVVAVVILVVSTLTAFLKGFALELISLAGTIGGLVLAVLFYRSAAQLLSRFDLHPMAADFLGFLAIFLASVIAASIIGGAVRKTLKALKLSWLDRGFGGLFGLLRGCLINIVIFLAFVAFPINNAALEGSKLKNYFLPAAHVLGSYAPDDFKQKMLDGLKYLQEDWLDDQESESDSDRI